MTALRGTFRIVCEGCGTSIVTPWHEVTTAREEAKRAGWLVACEPEHHGIPKRMSPSASASDYCPDCRKRGYGTKDYHDGI